MDLVEDATQNTETDADNCNWCDVSLGYAKLIHGTVCAKCYHLLKGASVGDEVIFQRPATR